MYLQRTLMTLYNAAQFRQQGPVEVVPPLGTLHFLYPQQIQTVMEHKLVCNDYERFIRVKKTLHSLEIRL